LIFAAPVLLPAVLLPAFGDHVLPASLMNDVDRGLRRALGL
jgi:hypothetical protein